MKRIIALALVFISFSTIAQVDLSYYLPSDVSYSAKMPKPEQVLGYEVGEWHVGHDQLLYYMRALSKASDRAIINEYATSYEGRPLINLIFTAPENHAKLDQIKADHLALTDPSQSANIRTDEMPIVIWLGYSVHGNEASAVNSTLLTAYHLAAAQGEAIENLLKNAIIIIDPCLNPDGSNRFASWVNSHKSFTINPDPNSREFSEAWPRGRTNHYWFDLNRDWLPLAHPESRGRIALFQEWKPNILTDHHEMGTNSTFFFQPGIPSRKFPWTPEKNVELTHKMAAFHSKYLDDIGTLYYSEESYDDFYIGKGSAYPDQNGGVAILFEQASSRGHAQENDFGLLTFPMTIKNQFTVSLSTMASGIAHRKEFLDYQKKFYRASSELAAKDDVKAYVFGSEKDPYKNIQLVKMLLQHKIDVYQLNQSMTKDGKSFSNKSSYIVPLDQPQYRLVKGIFETRTTFNDSLFYDVSTWTMPLAYNLHYAELGKSYSTKILGEKVEAIEKPKGRLHGKKGAYAYLIEPFDYLSFKAIHRLLSKQVVVQVLNETHTDGERKYPRGSMLIPMGVQQTKKELIEQTIDLITIKDGVDVYALNTGLAVNGVDLGSRSNTTIREPKVAVLVDGGVNSYEAGEVWHLLDQRFGMKVTLLPLQRLNGADLSIYNRIVLVNGNYASINESGVKKLKNWVSLGGVIVSWKRGGKWLSDQKITGVPYASKSNDLKGYRPYEDLNEYSGAQVTGGSIFEAKVDLSHPLAYGLENDRIPLFRNHNLVMEKSNNLYANPLVYTSSPLLSGYVSKENLARFKNSPAATVSTVGKGRVITFADNPNFRAFWYGTNKLFMNALFYGPIINRNAGE